VDGRRRLDETEFVPRAGTRRQRSSFLEEKNEVYAEKGKTVRFLSFNESVKDVRPAEIVLCRVGKGEEAEMVALIYIQEQARWRFGV